MKQTVLILAVLMMIGSSFGCRSSRRGEPLAGPLPNPSIEVARGEVVFNQHCSRCHPGGEGGLGPALNNKPAPVFLMKTQVRLGLGVMPGFSREEISSEELEDLMDYMMRIRRHKAGRSND